MFGAIQEFRTFFLPALYIAFLSAVIPTDDLNRRLDSFMVLVDAAAVPVTDHEFSTIQ